MRFDLVLNTESELPARYEIGIVPENTRLPYEID